MSSGAVAIAIGGWIIGFLSSVTGTHVLERRRAIRALISCAEAVRSEIRMGGDYSGIHAHSFDDLGRAYFIALPFLNQQKQGQAREKWHYYRTLQLAHISDPGLVPDIMNKLGHPTQTKDRALTDALDALIDVFTDRWP